MLREVLFANLGASLVLRLLDDSLHSESVVRVGRSEVKLEVRNHGLRALLLYISSNVPQQLHIRKRNNKEQKELLREPSKMFSEATKKTSQSES